MKLKYISWLPAVIIMGMIFFFSSRPDTNSNQSSLTVANTILNIYDNITEDGIQEESRYDVLDRINHYVRKAAHFTEYALLAIAIFFHLWVWDKKRVLRLLIPIIISGLYAAMDEYHQTFVQGRSGQWTDVLLDISGAVTGTIVFFIVTVFVLLRRGKSV